MGFSDKIVHVVILPVEADDFVWNPCAIADLGTSDFYQSKYLRSHLGEMRR